MEFIRRRRDDAASFIKVLSMRQETLFRVMSAIMKLQKEFFMTDDELALKPMILKDVAELTGYDISVVSRATSGKYSFLTNVQRRIPTLRRERFLRRSEI